MSFLFIEIYVNTVFYRNLLSKGWGRTMRYNNFQIMRIVLANGEREIWEGRVIGKYVQFFN